jgi:hypothetical protein
MFAVVMSEFRADQGTFYGGEEGSGEWERARFPRPHRRGRIEAGDMGFEASRYLADGLCTEIDGNPSRASAIMAYSCRRCPGSSASNCVIRTTWSGKRATISSFPPIASM